MQRPTPVTYHELQLAVDTFNKELFDGTLPDCLITLQRRPRTAGYFSPLRFGTRRGQTTDEIALNPEYFAIHPLLHVLQTIVHEQVHQWQHHHGAPSRKTYHDRQWAEKMEAIGLMPSSTGQPGGRKVGQKMMDYPIPGGRFMQIAERLLADRTFVITWYDRFPPRVPEMLDAPGPQPIASPSDSPASRSPPPDWAVPAVHDGVVVGERTPATPPDKQATDRSNRVRYVCPKCTAKVWGKPSMRIGCLGCGVAFRPTTPARQETGQRTREP